MSYAWKTNPYLYWCGWEAILHFWCLKQWKSPFWQFFHSLFNKKNWKKFFFQKTKKPFSLDIEWSLLTKGEVSSSSTAPTVMNTYKYIIYTFKYRNTYGHSLQLLLLSWFGRWLIWKNLLFTLFWVFKAKNINFLVPLPLHLKILYFSCSLFTFRLK